MGGTTKARLAGAGEVIAGAVATYFGYPQGGIPLMIGGGKSLIEGDYSGAQAGAIGGAGGMAGMGGGGGSAGNGRSAALSDADYLYGASDAAGSGGAAAGGGWMSNLGSMGSMAGPLAKMMGGVSGNQQVMPPQSAQLRPTMPPTFPPIDGSAQGAPNGGVPVPATPDLMGNRQDASPILALLRQYQGRGMA